MQGGDVRSARAKPHLDVSGTAGVSLSTRQDPLWRQKAYAWCPRHPLPAPVSPPSCHPNPIAFGPRLSPIEFIGDARHPVATRISIDREVTDKLLWISTSVPLSKPGTLFNSKRVARRSSRLSAFQRPFLCRSRALCQIQRVSRVVHRVFFEKNVLEDRGLAFKLKITGRRSLDVRQNHQE